MSKLRTAPEKKRAAYKLDHRTEMEKKARINRSRRRVGDRAAQSVLRGGDPEAVLVPKRVRGEHMYKVGVGTLGEAVSGKQDRRRTDFLPRYLGWRYDAGKHAEPFARFLAALVRSRSALAASRAVYLSWLLDARLPNNSPIRYKRTWLEQFFRSSPEWEVRLRAWIRQVEGRTPWKGAAEQ